MEFDWYCWWKKPGQPVEVGSLSHYWHGLLHPKWLAGFLTSTVAQESFQFQLGFALLICSLCAVMGFEAKGGEEKWSRWGNPLMREWRYSRWYVLWWWSWWWWWWSDDGGGSHLHYYSFSLILLWLFIHTVFQEFARCNIVAWRLATSWAIQAIWKLIFAATKVDCWECQPSSCSWDLKHFFLAGSSRVLTLIVLFGQRCDLLSKFSTSWTHYSKPSKTLS